MAKLLRVLGVILLVPCGFLFAQETDPFLWLEEVEGEKALAWAKERNAHSTKALEAVPEYEAIFDEAQKILDSQEKIPSPTLRGKHVYNFWQDASHERGIWRRTTVASYREAEPDWETVLDLDALSEADGTPWVFKAADCLEPEYRLCMVSLSRGGADATVEREFDTVAKSFVDCGFRIPEAKTTVVWKDADTLWVASDFGKGSLTSSGYPRIVKEWRRDTPLAKARIVYTGAEGDVGAFPSSIYTPEKRYLMVVRIPVFYRSDNYLALADRLVRLDIPFDAQFQGIFRDRLLFSLRSDWEVGETTFRQGSLLAGTVDDVLQRKGAFTVLFEPSERASLRTVATTRDRVLLTTLDNVRSRFFRVALTEDGWKSEEVELAGLGTVGIEAAGDDSDTAFYTYQDFLTPDSLYLLEGDKTEKVKSMPAFFDAAGMNVAQHEATSADGTKIPYFLVTPRGFEANGKAPTMLYGYGGFEIPMVPRYRGVNGTAWLSRGGVYVLANLRGGGEFGPRWHEAALKEKRIKSFEDFIVVAEDLVARKITSPRHLGIIGGSQGGLLVGGAFTLRPELFRAVVCQVPLLDMKRFNKLLAGASWMAEYGNPDIPEEWAFIKTWSPYHLVKKDVTYPEVFFWTNTRDDRVHPGHARKMVAKMLAQEHPVYYFENIEGGHGSGSVNRQRAYTNALEFAYLWKMLR